MAFGIEGKQIVLGVCGGIAAYKSVELLRLMTGQGAHVRVMMTANARRFVGPMTFEALSGRKVCTSLWEDSEDAAIRHIHWAEAADAVVIAPATANIIGKMAGGIADDALSTFILAVTCPVLLCPSMNSHMYASRPVQRNLEVLKNDGHLVLDPAAGDLACGTVGPGRLPEPTQIVDVLISHLATKDLRGKNILVTAGPTREAIDPVRFISNPSSGKMGYAIAQAAERRGANVLLVTGPTELAVPANVRINQVETAAQMAEAVLSYMDHADMIIKCAAVSDYRPTQTADQKIKKNRDQIQLALEKTQDILKEVGRRKKHQILVGFAAETDQLRAHATGKLAAKNLDMVVGNLVGRQGSGFASDTNRATLFYRDGHEEDLELMPKTQLANVLLDRIAGLGSNDTPNGGRNGSDDTAG